MDGFIREALAAKAALLHGRRLASASRTATSRRDRPRCELGKPVDVMGYHDAREIPNYWAYAHQFVLQDHMFEPNDGWSLPAHLFAVSAWSALCTKPTDPMSCRSDLDDPPDGPAALRKRYPTRPALRLDRPDVPAAPQPRQLGVLRLPRDAARLRRRGGADVPAEAAQGAGRRASGIRCRGSPRSAGTASSGTSRPLEHFVEAREAVACPPSRGSSRLQAQRAPPARSSATGRPG